MKPARSVLVVVTRRIGDVLLTTPLIRSIKAAWPEAAIDVLVFAGTEGVLAANSDVRRVITIAERPRWHAHLRLLASIARRYDVALSVVPSDRPTLYAWLGGRWRAGIVPAGAKHRWKTWLLQRCVPFDTANTHTVLMHLRLADVLRIPRSYEVVTAWQPQAVERIARELPFELASPYAVLHTFPKFNYKMWRSEAWTKVAVWLRSQGLRIVLTGGGDPAELEYVNAIACNIPDPVSVAGKLTLSESACLVARARAYVGPDTAMTHIAAAAGIPVIALYGPSDPVKWGPWPAGYASEVNPWRRFGTQRVNNVTLMQGATACVPCLNEGCDRHIGSFSDCLQQLPSERVIAVLDAAMRTSQARASR